MSEPPHRVCHTNTQTDAPTHQPLALMPSCPPTDPPNDHAPPAHNHDDLVSYAPAHASRGPFVVYSVLYNKESGGCFRVMLARSVGERERERGGRWPTQHLYHVAAGFEELWFARPASPASLATAECVGVSQFYCFGCEREKNKIFANTTPAIRCGISRRKARILSRQRVSGEEERGGGDVSRRTFALRRHLILDPPPYKCAFW